MSNCPYVPYGKKCVYEEHHKELFGCCCRIIGYRLQELKMELPLIGGLFEPYICDNFEEYTTEEDGE